MGQIWGKPKEMSAEKRELYMNLRDALYRIQKTPKALLESAFALRETADRIAELERDLKQQKDNFYFMDYNPVEETIRKNLSAAKSKIEALRNQVPEVSEELQSDLDLASAVALLGQNFTSKELDEKIEIAEKQLGITATDHSNEEAARAAYEALLASPVDAEYQANVATALAQLNTFEAKLYLPETQPKSDVGNRERRLCPMVADHSEPTVDDVAPDTAPAFVPAVERGQSVADGRRLEDTSWSSFVEVDLHLVLPTVGIGAGALAITAVIGYLIARRFRRTKHALVKLERSVSDLAMPMMRGLSRGFSSLGKSVSNMV